MKTNYSIIFQIFTIFIFNCNREEAKYLTGHSEKVYSIAVLKNGDLASGSEDRTIKIWNINNGSLKMTLSGHLGKVFSLAVLINGDLASGSADKTIKIWNTNNGVSKITLNGHSDWIWSLAVLKNGDLASGSRDKDIKIWDINNKSLKTTLSGHSNEVFSLVVLKNGDLVSGSRDKTIKIWNLDDGSIKSTLNGHANWINSLAALKNGDLASVSNDEIINVWDTNDGSLKKTFGRHNRIESNMQFCKLAVLNNGDLASGFLETIKIWNKNNGSLKKTLTDHGRLIQSLSVLYNGDLAAGNDDGSIRIWNMSLILGRIEDREKTKSDTKVKKEIKSSSSYSKQFEGISEGDMCYFKGSIADKDHCQGYFNCKGDVVKKMQCPDKKLFDEKSNTCKEFKDVICGNRSLSNSKKDLCSSRPNGSYPTFENGCAEFFKCENSKTVIKSDCPNGLKFNMISFKCDNASNIPPPCGTKITSDKENGTDFNFTIFFGLISPKRSLESENGKNSNNDEEFENFLFFIGRNITQISTNSNFSYFGAFKLTKLPFIYKEQEIE
ncbi:hypothetical protein BpHYR1_016202 [Brachionus plicatilis]|uniref:Chitin-binding type-2 domain-containing protein n=1 Tax=Brachionus plicatilis TaxID=10195 RepID=A0A3M7R354_BRAPC|nr:hypothetical protein BpHYR1_016202 [Brachionus plicatilis]